MNEENTNHTIMYSKSMNRELRLQNKRIEGILYRESMGRDIMIRNIRNNRKTQKTVTLTMVTMSRRIQS